MPVRLLQGGVGTTGPPRKEEWSDLRRDRSGFQRRFVELLLATPQLRGRVLDVGCAADLPGALTPIRASLGVLDGVDPDPAVHQHPLLKARWCAPFEQCGAPAAAYDMVFAYNVLEHICDPRPFFAQVSRVLKPGGVFWGLTPNRNHPFTLLSRSIELAGLKPLFRRQLGTSECGQVKVNDYPAFYRCNSPHCIVKAIKGLGFAKVSFHFFPCLQWDTYFPKALRWLPNAYDFLLGTRVTRLMQILIVRLEKEGTGKS